jgi:hypothetical protein
MMAPTEPSEMISFCMLTQRFHPAAGHNGPVIYREVLPDEIERQVRSGELHPADVCLGNIRYEAEAAPGLEMHPQFGDEMTAASVAATFTRAPGFWKAVEGRRDAYAAALDLLQFEGGPARALVARYIDCARFGMLDGEATARLDVVQFGLVMLWGPGDEPLTERRRLPRFPQISRALDSLERMLAGNCATPGCDQRAQGGFLERKRAAARLCCCTTHNWDQRDSRRRVRRLLIHTAETTGTEARSFTERGGR